MSGEVLFINEEFFKRMIPSVRSIDDSQVVAAIRLVQKTNLLEIISEPVYNYLQTIFADDDDFSAGEQRLFNHIQSFLAVKVAHELTMSAPLRDNQIRDEASKVYNDKATMLEGMIIRDINNDSALLSLAQSSNVETWYNDDADNNGGFYFA